MHEPAIYNLGYAYIQVGELENAITTYRHGVHGNENSAECHFNLASALEDQKQYDEARTYFKRCSELDPNNIDCLVRLG